MNARRPHDVGHGLGVPALREHADRNHVPDRLALGSGATDGIHLPAQQLGLLLLGRLAPSAAASAVLAAAAVFVQLRHRFLDRLRCGKHLGVDVQGMLRVAQLVDADPVVVERVLDPRRGFGAVGHGDHHWRGRRGLAVRPLRRPLPGDFAPVVAEQIVAVGHQIRQWLLGPSASVQVVLDLGVVVDVVEARPVGLGVRARVVANHHAWRLDEPSLDGVVQAEVAHDPAEQRFLGTPLPGWRERGGGEVTAGQDTARTVDPIQAADPLGGGLDLFLRDAPDLGLGGYPPGMVRFVVDDQEVARACQVAEHLAHVRFIALGAALVDAALAADPLRRLPIERMPVADQDRALPQLVGERGGHDAERLVVVLGVGRLQHGQAIAHRETGSDHQHVPGVSHVVRIGDLVQHLPGDDHRHDHGLAGPGRHLGAQARERSTVGCDLQTHLVGRRRLREPDQRLRGFRLTEEEAPVGELLRIVPVGEQPPGDSGHPRIPVLTPPPHARADPVYQRDLDEHAGIVECLGVRRRHHVPRRSAPLDQIEQPGLALVSPVARRFLVGRVDDQPVDRRARHYSSSIDAIMSSRAMDDLRGFQYRLSAQMIAAVLDAPPTDQIDIPPEIDLRSSAM